MKTEHCCECDCETGNAGRNEDSIYIEFEGKEIGPLCDICADELNDKIRQEKDYG